MEHNFKIGERVRVVRPDGVTKMGDTGTVVCINWTGGIGVCFDRHLGDFGHNCGAMCKEGHGRFVAQNEVIPLSKTAANTRLIITKDGDITTARRVCEKKDITEVSVKRYYKDKDDEFLAAIRAVEKLYNRSVTELCEASDYKAKTSVTLVNEYATRQKALALRLLADLEELNKNVK